MLNYSYVTVLTNDSYVLGVLLLSESLKKVNSKYPLTVLLTNNVCSATQEILKQLKINYRLVNNISMSQQLIEHNQNINPIMANIWENCFTKFKIFDLLDFNKIVFLDADIMVLKNLDHLFNAPHMTSALDGEYFNLWPDWPHFNTGCLVIEPSHEIFKDILQFANNLSLEDLKQYDYVMADQEILNLYYNDWINKNDLHLNKYYDIFAPYILEEHLEDVKTNCYFIHYTGRKPWQYFVKNEYDIYSEWSYEQGKKIIVEACNQINWPFVCNKLKISVYAICKNEKNNLDKWLKCFSKADYICILDTGSTDGTWETLQDYCKQYSNLIISQQIIKPWRFDVARNLSLELVPKDTDIYFMVDLDEIIKENNWVNKIKEVWDPTFTRGVYNYHRDTDENGNALKTIPEFRIHSKKWSHYENIVHEVIVTDFGQKMFDIQECIPMEIEVWHFPKQNKKTNYLQLCEEELKEYPNDPLMRLQLAIEYELEEQFDKAIEHFQIIINNNTNLQWFEIGRCYAGIGYCYYAKQDLNNSLNYFREGRLVSPFYADNYLIAAQIYFENKDYEKTIQLIEDALNYCYPAVWCSISDIQNYIPYYILGLSYFNLKNMEKAVYYLTLASYLNNSNEVKNNLNAAITNCFTGKKFY